MSEVETKTTTIQKADKGGPKGKGAPRNLQEVLQPDQGPQAEQTVQTEQPDPADRTHSVNTPASESVETTSEVQTGTQGEGGTSDPSGEQEPNAGVATGSGEGTGTPGTDPEKEEEEESEASSAHEILVSIQLKDHVRVDVRGSSADNGQYMAPVEKIFKILFTNPRAKVIVKPTNVDAILNLLGTVESIKGYPNINQDVRERAIRDFKIANGLNG